MSATVLFVSNVGGSGPKATAIDFLKNEDGNRPWAWVSNEIAALLVPGMMLRVEHVSPGKVKTTYEKNGETFELKVPRVQLFLGGTMEIDAPETEPVPEITVKVSDAAAKYREAYLAKRQAPPADEPF